MFTRVSDLWDLPHAQLTATLTENIEHNFYSRCPPDQRPQTYRAPPNQLVEHEDGSDAPTTVSEENRGGDKKSYGKKGRPLFEQKSKIFKSDIDGNKIYDSSLVKALHRTFFSPWWTAGLLKLIAGMFCRIGKFCIRL